MVNPLIDQRQDAVAQRLSSASDGGTHRVVDWLEAQQVRAIMRRRASWCAWSGWILMVVASIVSSGVALVMSREAMAIFRDTFESSARSPSILIITPVVLTVVAAIITAGGLAAWWGGWFPGWCRTVSAIDWSSSSDAVSRLLDVGCTYPEAFRLAADVTASRSSRAWLLAAAERVEQGGQAVAPNSYGYGDTALMEALVDRAGDRPERYWRIAANHFLELASRRLVLFLQAMPMIAILVSGLLIWIAVTSTLGWMWRAVAEMMRGLN